MPLNNTSSIFDSSVLTISSDLETVLQVLNEVVPNLEEVSSYHIHQLIVNIKWSLYAMFLRLNFVQKKKKQITEWLKTRRRRWDRYAHAGAPEPGWMCYRQGRPQDQGASRGKSILLKCSFSIPFHSTKFNNIP